MYGKLSFVDEAGEETEVYVIEETKINNMNYLLVTESDETDEDEELEAYIFRMFQMQKMKRLYIRWLMTMRNLHMYQRYLMNCSKI